MEPEFRRDVSAVQTADSAQLPRQAPRTIASTELLKGDRELRISHGTDVYRLLLTRTGKLLLQK